MCIRDRYTPPNKTKLDSPNKVRKNILQPIILYDWKKDHKRAKVEVMTSERTNKSAWIIRYHGWASAETSTLRKNQNQYPPKHVIIAPTCQRIGYIIGVFIAKEE